MAPAYYTWKDQDSKDAPIFTSVVLLGSGNTPIMVTFHLILGDYAIDVTVNWPKVIQDVHLLHRESLQPGDAKSSQFILNSLQLIE